MMNRTLVLTSEQAHHPFRRSLPAHVTRAMPVFEPEVEMAMARNQLREAEAATPLPAPFALGGSMSLFLKSYCACFLAVTLFLA